MSQRLRPRGRFEPLLSAQRTPVIVRKKVAGGVRVVPFPNRLQDCPCTAMVSMWKQAQWAQNKTLRNWIRESRLDGFGKLMIGMEPQDTAKLAIITQLREQARAAMANLPLLIAATSTTGDTACP